MWWRWIYLRVVQIPCRRSRRTHELNRRSLDLDSAVHSIWTPPLADSGLPRLLDQNSGAAALARSELKRSPSPKVAAHPKQIAIVKKAGMHRAPATQRRMLVNNIGQRRLPCKMHRSKARERRMPRTQNRTNATASFSSAARRRMEEGMAQRAGNASAK